MPSSLATEKAMPPLAVPSSLAIMMSVISTDSANFCAWMRPFWPVVASITSSTSWGAVGDVPLHDRAELVQLLHQVELGVQPAGGVDDQDVDAAAVGGLHGVEDDRAGVGALLVGDDRHAQALAPDLELVDGGGAEGVAGRQHDRAAELLVVGDQLGDRGGLADAVDADDHDHEGHAALQDLHLAVAGRQLQQLDHLLAQDLAGDRADR